MQLSHVNPLQNNNSALQKLIMVYINAKTLVLFSIVLKNIKCKTLFIINSMVTPLGVRKQLTR